VPLGAMRMSKKTLVAILCLAIGLVIYFGAFRPANPVNTAITTMPTTSLEESICERVTAQFGDCKKILLFDTHSKLVFAESSSGIIPVLTNNEFTEFKTFIAPMDFQEFREEKEERGPIDWRVDNVQKDFSVVYGFAENDAKTIVINSEGNVQPNRFYVGDNLWVWYLVFQKEKVDLPVEVSVYDDNGQMISGE
jgi:hemolysin-activating ACP:hemolysin acyltransferase